MSSSYGGSAAPAKQMSGSYGSAAPMNHGMASMPAAHQQPKPAAAQSSYGGAGMAKAPMMPSSHGAARPPASSSSSY